MKSMPSCAEAVPSRQATSSGDSRAVVLFIFISHLFSQFMLFHIPAEAKTTGAKLALYRFC
jgi:hypothetical protein